MGFPHTPAVDHCTGTALTTPYYQFTPEVISGRMTTSPGPPAISVNLEYAAYSILNGIMAGKWLTAVVEE